jgi:putative ABC transport system permease protein
MSPTSWLAELRRRLAMITGRDRFDRDLEEEMRLHADLKAEEFEAAGITPDDSRRLARAVVGNNLVLREESHEAWGWAWLETLVQDLRYGARVLRKAPGFAVSAILTLALGTGATTTVFSAIYGVLLRPLPYTSPGRLIVLHETTPQVGQVSVSHPNFVDWQTSARSFSAMSAVYSTDAHLSGLREPRVVSGNIVSANFLTMLGVHPELGRDFTAADEVPHAAPIAMVSDAVWRSQFGADPGALGRTVVLDGIATTIVAVLPPGFQTLDPIDILQPLGAIADDSAFNARGQHGDMVVIGRLADGVSLDAATAEMRGIAARLATQYPATNDQYGVDLKPIRDTMAGTLRTTLWLLFGAVAFLLLIACANVANLLLVRAAARGKEISLRVTCGASRGRIIRQMVTESLVLAVCGGVAGLALAAAGVRGFEVLLTPFALVGAPIGLSGWVLLFTALMALATTLFFGLVPAVYATRPSLQAELKESSRTTTATRSQQRLRSALATLEIALALLLLVGAGLMARSLLGLMAVDPGFRTDRLLTIGVSLSTPRYADGTAVGPFWTRLLTEARALPGVESAALGTGVPLTGNHSRSDVTFEGMPLPRVGQWPHPDVHRVTPGYLATLGVPLLRGRDFTDADSANQPRVALISQQVADRFFPHDDAVGKRLMFGHPPAPANGPPRWLTIVGVVGPTKLYGYENPARLEVYVSAAQQTRDTMTLILKSSLDPAALTSAARSVVSGIDPDQPISQVVTMTQLRSDALSSSRLVLTLLGLFSGLAVLLAVVGVYGVVSYGVARRTHEVGIRMALGAAPMDILRTMVGEGAMVAGIGVGAGLALAAGLTRLLSGLLFAVSPLDAVTFGAVSLVVAGVALAATYVPARRAIRVSPVNALRSE